MSVPLSELRRQIGRLEGSAGGEARPALIAADRGDAWGRKAQRGLLPFGVASLDGLLGGGLPLGTLHEVRAGESRDAGAGGGFVLACLAHLAARCGAAPVVWISEAPSRREGGDLYAPGLAAIGLDPGRMVHVPVRSAREAIWAFEAALSSRQASAAVCELRRISLSLSATRRCLLRAQSASVTGFLLRLAMPAEPTAAELRLSVSPAPAATIDGFERGVGRMAWRIGVEKNRRGRTGAVSVEWNAHDKLFCERRVVGDGRAAPHPQPVAATPAARSDRASGEVVRLVPHGGWRRAS